MRTLLVYDTISEKSEMIEGYCIMNIYEKIFARLEELDMSQIELSRRTGIATSTISDWRKKKINPQADRLLLFARHLICRLWICFVMRKIRKIAF